MKENSNLNVVVDPELLEKFKLALMLNKEKEESAINSMIKRYITESFSNATKEIFSDKETDLKNKYLKESRHYVDHLYPTSPKYGKANRKIPIWAHREYQNNHKIIKAFFQIKSEEKMVSVDDLKKRCTNQELYPDTFCYDFDGNFAAMKSDSSNSHGKVFIVENSQVKIWGVIADVLESYRIYFS